MEEDTNIKVKHKTFFFIIWAYNVQQWDLIRLGIQIYTLSVILILELPTNNNQKLCL